MTIEHDKKFNAEATELLDKKLLGQQWSSFIDKKLLLEMYSESRRLVRQGSKDKKIAALANAIHDCVLRVVRCLCLSPEAATTIIRGRTVEMEAESLYEQLTKDFKQLKYLQATSKS